MQPTQVPVTTAGDPKPCVGETLRAAALYLSRHGWVQGSYYDQTATVFTPAACLVGALAMVCYGGPVEAPAEHLDTPEGAMFEAALSYLDGFLRIHHGVIAYEFNDAKGRTLGEVLAVLEEAAQVLDRVHGGAP